MAKRPFRSRLSGSFLLAIAFVASTATRDASAEKRQAGSSVPAGTVADVLLDSLHRQIGVPGLAAAVAVRGELVWHGEAGFADVGASKPVTSDTVFRLASVSKAVCSLIAAKLVETDVLALDSRAGEFIPDLPDQYRDIRLRDLMTHSSGLPHYEARDASRGNTRYATALAGLELLGDRPLVSAPGGRYVYTTHGFSLASAMMENASEKSFPQLFHELIGADGAVGVGLESEQRLVARRTEIYDRVKGRAAIELQREDFSYSWCGAGMEASASALSRFASTVFADDGPLGERGRGLIIDPLDNRSGVPISTDRWVMTLGWRRSTDVRGRPYLHHAGVTNGARSILALWPDTGIAVALLSNASWTGRMEDTAVALGLSARASAASSCERSGRDTYQGRFGDASLVASIDWQDSGDGCRATIQTEGALSDWLEPYRFAEDKKYLLHSLPEDRWALVTPIGISVLEGEPSRLAGSVGSRILKLERARSAPNN